MKIRERGETVRKKNPARAAAEGEKQKMQRKGKTVDEFLFTLHSARSFFVWEKNPKAKTFRLTR